MLSPGAAKLLTIYLNEGDKWHHLPLHLALLDQARKAGLAGVTLLHTLGGTGSHGRIHSDASDYLLVDMPIVVQIIDREEVIRAFLPIVDEMVREGLVTLSDLEIVAARRS